MWKKKFIFVILTILLVLPISFGQVFSVKDISESERNFNPDIQEWNYLERQEYINRYVKPRTDKTDFRYGFFSIFDFIIPPPLQALYCDGGNYYERAISQTYWCEHYPDYDIIRYGVNYDGGSECSVYPAGSSYATSWCTNDAGIDCNIVTYCHFDTGVACQENVGTCVSTCDGDGDWAGDPYCSNNRIRDQRKSCPDNTWNTETVIDCSTVGGRCASFTSTTQGIIPGTAHFDRACVQTQCTEGDTRNWYCDSAGRLGSEWCNNGVWEQKVWDICSQTNDEMCDIQEGQVTKKCKQIDPFVCNDGEIKSGSRMCTDSNTISYQICRNNQYETQTESCSVGCSNGFCNEPTGSDICIDVPCLADCPDGTSKVYASESDGTGGCFCSSEQAQIECGLQEPTCSEPSPSQRCVTLDSSTGETGVLTYTKGTPDNNCEPISSTIQKCDIDTQECVENSDGTAECIGAQEKIELAGPETSCNIKAQLPSYSYFSISTGKTLEETTITPQGLDSLLFSIVNGAPTGIFQPNNPVKFTVAQKTQIPCRDPVYQIVVQGPWVYTDSGQRTGDLTGQSIRPADKVTRSNALGRALFPDACPAREIPIEAEQQLVFDDEGLDAYNFVEYDVTYKLSCRGPESINGNENPCGFPCGAFSACESPPYCSDSQKATTLYYNNNGICDAREITCSDFSLNGDRFFASTQLGKSGEFLGIIPRTGNFFLTLGQLFGDIVFNEASVIARDECNTPKACTPTSQSIMSVSDITGAAIDDTQSQLVQDEPQTIVPITSETDTFTIRIGTESKEEEMECTTDNDCGNNEECVNQICSPIVFEECTSDNDCLSDEVCNQFNECVIPSSCGNGILEQGEQCDRSLLRQTTCADFNPDAYASGTLSCKKDATCTYDKSDCVEVAEPICSDGTAEGECSSTVPLECVDGELIASQTCCPQGQTLNTQTGQCEPVNICDSSIDTTTCFNGQEQDCLSTTNLWTANGITCTQTQCTITGCVECIDDTDCSDAICSDGSTVPSSCVSGSCVSDLTGCQIDPCTIDPCGLDINSLPCDTSNLTRVCGQTTTNATFYDNVCDATTAGATLVDDEVCEFACPSGEIFIFSDCRSGITVIGGILVIVAIFALVFSGRRRF